jgi:hypothetical protein
MTGMQIGLINRPIRKFCYLLWGNGYGPPKIGKKTVRIIYRFDFGNCRSPKKHGQRASKGLNVIGNIPYIAPNLCSHPALSAKPWKGSL